MILSNQVATALSCGDAKPGSPPVLRNGQSLRGSADEKTPVLGRASQPWLLGEQANIVLGVGRS